MTNEEIKTQIDEAEITEMGEMNWVGMEEVLVGILQSEELDAVAKVKWAKKCIDAFTRRKYFN